MTENEELMQEIARQMSSREFIPRGTEFLIGIADRGATVAGFVGRCHALPVVDIVKLDGKLNRLSREIPINLTKACLIDDTISSGRTFDTAQEILAKQVPQVKIVGGAVVVLERMKRGEVNFLLSRMDLK